MIILCLACFILIDFLLWKAHYVLFSYILHLLFGYALPEFTPKFTWNVAKYTPQSVVLSTLFSVYGYLDETLFLAYDK